MSVVFLLLGAGTGVGLLLALGGLAPPRPPLAAAVTALHQPPPTRQGLLEALTVPGRRLGLPRPGTRADLAVLDRDPTSYLARLGGLCLLGLLTPAALATAAALAGLHTGPAAPLWAGLLLAAAAVLVTHTSLRQQADNRRLLMRHTLAALLDVVPAALAAGAGVEQALTDAAGTADGWAADRIRHALRTARLTRTPLWQPLQQLGDTLGVTQLQQLAATLRLATGEGAHIRHALLTRGDALTERLTTDQLTQAEAATERMSIPLMLLTTIFLVFLVYPAITAVHP